MLEWRLGAYRRWLTMSEPTWARVHLPESIRRDHVLLLRTEIKERPEEPRRDRSGIPPHLADKLGIPLRKRPVLFGVQGARVAVDAVLNSVSVVTTFPRGAEEGGGYLLLDVGGDPRISGDPRVVFRLGGTGTDNFFATLNSAVFWGGTSFIFQKECAARWSSPPISESMTTIAASSSGL